MRVPVPWTLLIHLRFRLLDTTLLPDFPGGELRSMILKACGETALGGNAPPSVLCQPRPQSGTRWSRASRLRRRAPGHEVDARIAAFGPRLSPSTLLKSLSAVGRRAILGHGPSQSRFEIVVDDVELMTLEGLTETQSSIVLEFISPLALREGHRVRETLPSGHDLLSHVASRARELSRLYGHIGDLELRQPSRLIVNPLSTPPAVIRLPRKGRDGSRMPMTGLVGGASVFTDLDEVHGVLALAQRIGLGRWTAFGFGQVRAR